VWALAGGVLGWLATALVFRSGDAPPSKDVSSPQEPLLIEEKEAANEGRR
jgi:hypothetical protein